MPSYSDSRHIPFKIRESVIQGKGAFATRRIRKDQRIIEYVGELINDEEVARRYDDESMSRHHTFLFEVDENVTIDGSIGSNDARYINHSCQPNCEAINEENRIYIFAKRNIQPGVELCYDYSYAQDEPLTEELRIRYQCRCGSPKCRGTILKVKKKRRSKRVSKNGRRNGSAQRR